MKQKVLGSWEPKEDTYYLGKREAGLIGRPEEYMSSGEDAAVDAYLQAVTDASE